MSTTLLYHGFGVREYRYVRTQYIRGGIDPEFLRLKILGIHETTYALVG